MTIYKNNSGVVRDPNEVVPYIGMTGRYALKAPYSALCHPSVEYTCTALTSIAGAIAQGGDPLQEVYLDNGGTQEDFDLDEASNHCLVTLQAGSGELVTVPNSALLALPDADGVLYAGVVLAVSLSALPVTTDLSVIKQDLADLVFSKLGVRVTVYPTVVTSPTVIDHVQHEVIEAVRQANIASSISVLSENTQLKAVNTALLAKQTLLETYIADNLIG